MAYQHNSSYAVEIRNAHKALKRTLDLYRNAVTYLLTPVPREAASRWLKTPVVTRKNKCDSTLDLFL